MTGIKVKFRGTGSWLHLDDYCLEDQVALYDDLLQDVINNPRFYLDYLTDLAEFRVCWASYEKGSVTSPYGCTPNGIKKKIGRKPKAL